MGSDWPLHAPTLVTPERSAWEAFVTTHPRGHLLQQPNWATLKAIAGWRTQRVAVAANGQLIAGAQIIFRGRFGFTMAYVPRGPLFTGQPEVDELLLAALLQVARRNRAVFLRLEPNVCVDEAHAPPLAHWLSQQRFLPTEPLQPRSTIHLDLTPSPDQLFAACSKGHRADIRRAERQGVTVRVGTTEADLDRFFAIMQATSSRAGFAIHSADYYRRAWALFAPRSRLLLAEHATSTIAAHLVFAGPHHGLYLYSGANDAGLRSGANHLLEWHALQWARTLGCHTYDFWGIPDALGRAATVPDDATRTALESEAQHDPLMGVYRFKKGFGGHVVRYLPAYDRILMPPLYALWLKSGKRGA